MALTALPQLPGGDINDSIVFKSQDSVQVVDEITAQKSATEFSTFLNQKRGQRQKTWDMFWSNRLDVNERILRAETRCFEEAQEEAAEYDSQYDEERPSFKPITVPFIVNATGSFDVPPPPPVTIPDPEDVIRQYQHMQAHASQEAQAQAQALRQHHTASARQRAGAKVYGRQY